MGFHRKTGVFLIFFGFFVAWALHGIMPAQSHEVFFRSDSFWLFGMPLVCVGLVLFGVRRKKDLKIGFFSKLALLLVAVSWIIAVILFVLR